MRSLLAAIVLSLGFVTATGTTATAAPLTLRLQVNESTFTVDALPGDTVEALKHKVQDARGFAPSAQRLFVEGVEMLDARTLADYGVGPSSVVEVVTVFGDARCNSKLIVGTSGDDQLRGTPLGDAILGTDGDDRIDAGATADCLRGGDGDDVLIGGSGNDLIEAGPGADIIEAGSGEDTIETWRDDEVDVISCGSGIDRLTMGFNDVLAPKHLCEFVELPGE